MQTCGNCKFKGEEITEDTFIDGDYVVLQTGYFLCGLIKMGGGDGAQTRELSGSSYVKDGSGYYAALCVASDFACNRWEAAIQAPVATPAPASDSPSA